MKQICKIDKYQYCEHDYNYVTIWERVATSNCCEKCDDWYQEFVEFCPICLFSLNVASEKTTKVDAVL